jgi:hypothetical protein
MQVPEYESSFRAIARSTILVAASYRDKEKEKEMHVLECQLDSYDSLAAVRKRPIQES